ncbi:MAG: hypothetical protein DWP98_09750 [Bacteroidetes bacterium]|nr:MAG: hypothetical protein DWP98_09750 [Bacteroidota bacterium]MBL1145906.1 hypothetical protein [Bacteroidota bacterium]NOG58700.1 hypothetical protein [Bacteroidota bacterium]
MKNLLIVLALILSANLSAQSDQTCFQKYAKVFEMRGADPVSDGTYKDVIVTIRKGSFADCFVGKVVVKNGAIDRNSIALSFVDNTFEPLRRSFKDSDVVNIINGMSKTMLTDDEELINIMFVSAIKPKKKAFKKAPEPSFDL